MHPGLIANPKVVLLPHMGTWTEEVRNFPFPISFSLFLSRMLADTNGDGIVDDRQCEKCFGDGEAEESSCGAKGYVG